MYINNCEYDMDFNVFQVKFPLSLIRLLYFTHYDE